MQPHRRPGSTQGVLLLLYQMLAVIGINRIPPVTLSLVGLQIAVFLRLFKLPWYGTSDVCISFYNVFDKREYSRLLFSAIEHVDDWHLYYNMISFVVKGQSLEQRFGSLKFLYITSVFTVLTNVMYLILSRLAGEIDAHFETQCAVGFSGVLFALKVLTTHFDHSHSYQIMGLPVFVPTRYVVWAELILIQMLVPNVSFLGHLAGVLVGLAYVTGPIKFVMDYLYSIVEMLLRPPLGFGQQESQHRTTRQENSQFSEYVPSGMSEEEQLQRATAASLNENIASYQSETLHRHQAPQPTEGPDARNMPSAPPAELTPDLSEIRRRRLELFQH